MPNPCIEAIKKASGDELSDREAAKLLRDMEQAAAERRKLRNYSTTAQAMREIAGELDADNATSFAKARRDKLLNERVNRDKVADAITSKAGAGQEMVNQIIGSENAKANERGGTMGAANTFIGQWQARIDRTLKALGDDVHDHFYSGLNPTEVRKEWQANSSAEGKPGTHGDKLDAAVGKVMNDLNSGINAELAALGANIVERDGFMGSQTWAQHRLHALGRKRGWNLFERPDKELAFKRFSEVEMSRWNEDVMTQGGRDEFLKVGREIFDNLWDDNHPQSGQPSNVKGGLSNRYARERVVIYKDAESFHAHEVELGRFNGNYAAAFLKMMENKARTLALLQDFGPGGKANIAERIRIAKERVNAMAPSALKDKSVAQLNAPHFQEKLERMYDMASGMTEVPANAVIAMVGQGLRSLALTTTGGAMLPNSLADIPGGVNQMTYAGATLMEALGRRFEYLFKNKHVSADVLHETGVGTGAYMLEVARTWRDVQMPELFSFVNQKFHNAILMTRWTESGRAGAAFDITERFGRSSDLPFDKLNPDMQRLAEAHKITPAEWDVMRKAVFTPDKGPLEGYKLLSHEQFYLLPEEDIAALVKADGNNPSNVGNMRRKVLELERKYGTMINERVSAAISEPGGPERWLTTGGGQKSGTFSGEVARSIGMYKGFLLSMTRRQYGQFTNLTPGEGLRMPSPRFMARTAATLATMLIAGYVSLTIQNLRKGMEAPRLFDDDGTLNTDTLKKAMDKSGYAGLYGSVLMQEYGRFGGGLADALAGPVFGKIEDAVDLGKSFIPSEEEAASPWAAREKLIERNIPGANIFYIKPALDHAIFWNVREMLQPGSLHRTERSAEGRGESWYVKPSEIAPLTLGERMEELGKMPTKAVESLTR